MLLIYVGAMKNIVSQLSFLPSVPSPDGQGNEIKLHFI